MEHNEVLEMLQREIAGLEEELSRRTAEWLRLKNDYEKWRDERRGEYGDSSADDELVWERGSSVNEYHALYITPLEEQLREKRENLKLFR